MVKMKFPLGLGKKAMAKKEARETPAMEKKEPKAYQRREDKLGVEKHKHRGMLADKKRIAGDRVVANMDKMTDKDVKKRFAGTRTAQIRSKYQDENLLEGGRKATKSGINKYLRDN